MRNVAPPVQFIAVAARYRKKTEVKNQKETSKLTVDPPASVRKRSL